jgi:hypothetical protein
MGFLYVSQSGGEPLPGENSFSFLTKTEGERGEGTFIKGCPVANMPYLNMNPSGLLPPVMKELNIRLSVIDTTPHILWPIFY